MSVPAVWLLGALPRARFAPRGSFTRATLPNGQELSHNRPSAGQ